jgi:XTP/dITP diphosphohydrolase
MSFIKINKPLSNENTQEIQEVLFASNNENKNFELKYLTQNSSFKIISLNEFSIKSNIKLPADIPEEGLNSYFDNAKIKAEFYFDWAGIPTLADDSGIEVNALGGKPGLQSARFAGENASAEECNLKLLETLKDCSDRRACLRSVLCLLIANGVYIFTEAIITGKISLSVKGSKGWGYEPVFILDGYNKTISELRDENIPYESHRALAFKKLVNLL